MAERKDIHKGNIGNALHSVAPDHVVTTAYELFDEQRQEYQEDINEGVGRYIENPEFIRVEVDNNDRIVRAIKADGTEYLGVGVDIAGNITTTTESPEFIRVYLDSSNKILWGIRTDGSVYFGAGVPPQIIDYINEKIAELSLDEYEDIVAFLDGIETGEKTLPELINEKVDKEEGKSLIDEEYAEGVYHIDNPEFLKVELDKNNRIVKAIAKDGTELFPAGFNVNGNVVKTIENPEFRSAWLVNNKIILAFESDGNVYFGIGIPKQIEYYVNGKTKILEGFDEDVNLKEFLEEVYGYYTDSSEYIQVIKDSVGHVLLAFNKFTGKPYFPSNDTYHVITNDEWLAAWITTNNQILFGFRKDGTTYIGDSNLVKAVKEINKYISYFNLDYNPEFLSVNVDEKNKLINGVKINGNNYFETPIETPSTIIQTIDNPEFVKAFVDDTNKLVSYRTKDGIKVENVGFKTNKLILTPEGMTEFQEDLKAAGFRPGGGGDFSDVITNKGKNPVYIPIPNCASLNIISNVDLTTLSKADRGGTQKVNYDVKVEVEFFDGQGIYFRKWALIGAQGNSSMDFIKKNIALKIFDTENVENNKGKWGKGDTFGIKFGDWVMQKSFYLKAYYTDYLRGGAMVAYQLADQAYKTRGFYRDRPWKEALRLL